MIMMWDVHRGQQYILFRDLALKHVALPDMERGSGTRHSMHTVQLLTLVLLNNGWHPTSIRKAV
jgi:hypothetical protein